MVDNFAVVGLAFGTFFSESQTHSWGVSVKRIVHSSFRIGELPEMVHTPHKKPAIRMPSFAERWAWQACEPNIVIADFHMATTVAYLGWRRAVLPTPAVPKIVFCGSSGFLICGVPSWAGCPNFAERPSCRLPPVSTPCGCSPVCSELASINANGGVSKSITPCMGWHLKIFVVFDFSKNIRWALGGGAPCAVRALWKK